MAVRPFLCLGDNALQQKVSRQRGKKDILAKWNCRRGSCPSIQIVEALYLHNYVSPFSSCQFSGTTLIAATIWGYESYRGRTYRLINRYEQFGVQKVGWRRDMEIWWKNLSDGEKVFAPICFLNILVFLAWRIPKLQPVMLKYFCTNPESRIICWPMLLSPFSHSSFIHLAGNMYVLYSFSSLAVSALGKEQFTALYLISAVVSSLTSNVYKAALGLRGPSLGASGAIMGILGYTCTQFPDIYLTIIFLPMYKFAASTGIKCLMGLDIVGAVCRWQFIDHAAHLGGVLFGMFWQAWGSANLWQKRETILAFWHDFRGPSKSR